MNKEKIFLSKKPYVIASEFQVKNSFPKNIKFEDKKFFRDVMIQKIPEFHLIQLDKIYVFYKFLVKNVIILEDYCSSHPIYWLDKIKIPVKYFFYKKKKIDKAISLVTLFGSNYHHFLVEVIPLIIYSQKILGDKIPFLIPDYYRKYSFIISYIDFLKIEVIYFKSREKVLIDKLYAFRNINVSCFNPEILTNIKNTFVAKHESFPWRKIYISRSKANYRKVLNERFLIPILEKNGYEVLILEELSIKSQIQIFSETKIVLGLHGAGLTNMLFMKKGGKIAELRADTDEKGIYNVFFCMANACGLDYYYLFGKGDHCKNKFSNISIPVDDLINLLSKLD